MKKHTLPSVVNSISELLRIFELPKPHHPQICLLQHAGIPQIPKDLWKGSIVNFYVISAKKDFKGKMRYGKNYYDFDEGTLTFVAPGQVIATEDEGETDCNGWTLFFHPDLIRNYPLGKKIKDYGFFSYAVNEALHLSEQEEAILESLLSNIELEYNTSIDLFSQDVLVSHLDLLLNYANRFYHRQFLTRKTAHSDLLTKLEDLLESYFSSDQPGQIGLPSVAYLSEQLNVSSNYLSDMLRTLTGLNTQQHIHHKLIEKAKDALSSTSLTVNEIAYSLGFEHPQSFSKLFKSKMNVTPLKFRMSITKFRN